MKLAPRSAARTLLTLLVLSTLVALVSAARAADDVGRALAERGQWKQLRAHVTPRHQAKPDDPEALWLMSQVKQAFGDPKGAVALAEKAVELAPRDADYRLQLAEALGSSAQKAGPVSGLKHGLRFKAEAQTTVSLDPRNVRARNGLVMFHLKAPRIAGGDKSKAAALVEEIAKIDPVEGHLARARYSLERRDTLAAERAMRQAAEAGATSYDAQVAAANFFASRRAWDETEKRARAALALDARRSGAHVLLAIAAAQRGRWSDLDAVLAAAEKATPDNLSAFYQAGRVLVTNHQEPERAERFLRRYLTVEPEGFSPSWAHARWRLAQALEHQGRDDEAVAELEAALALKPDLDDAKKDLKRLKRGRAVAKAR